MESTVSATRYNYVIEFSTVLEYVYSPVYDYNSKNVTQ